MEREKALNELIESLFLVKRKIVSTGHCYSGETDITPAQAVLLHIIKEKEGIGIKEISDSLKTTSSATTQLVDALVNKKLLKKISCTDDKRALKITLTENCKKNMAEIHRQGIKKIQTLFAVLSDQELEEFKNLSKKVADNVNAVV